MDIVKKVLKRFSAHNNSVACAGVAFYALLALVPTLLAVVSAYGLVTCEPGQVEEQVEQLASGLGDESKAFLTETLSSMAGTGSGCGLNQGLGELAGVIGGILLALWSASGAVQKLLTTVGVAYEVDDQRPGWKVRLVSYGFTFLLVVGMVLIIGTLAGVPVVLRQLNLGGIVDTLVTVGQFPVLAILFGAGTTIIYRYGTSRTNPTPWRNPGAIVATVLFILFGIGLSVYASFSGSMPASYGVLGGVAALMVFLQLATVAVVIGAEVNAEVEGAALGSRWSGNTAAGPLAATAASTTVEPVGFGKALAGVIALFILGRGPGS